MQIAIRFADGSMMTPTFDEGDDQRFLDQLNTYMENVSTTDPRIGGVYQAAHQRVAINFAQVSYVTVKD
jgi:hypothetical protein